MKKKQAAIKSGEVPGKDYIGESSAFDTFDRMVGKIEQSEAELEARKELASVDAVDASVDAELSKLTAASTADDALEALKAKMEAESGTPAPAAKPAEPAADDDKGSAIDDELAALRAKLEGDEE
jgi:phage shock protein A